LANLRLVLIYSGVLGLKMLVDMASMAGSWAEGLAKGDSKA